MYEQSTGRFAQRGPESPESKRLCQVTMESLVHLPHTSTGGQFPHARFQTVERGIFPAGRICQGNKQEDGQSNTNHSGSAYSYNRRLCRVSDGICMLGLVIVVSGTPGQGKSQ